MTSKHFFSVLLLLVVGLIPAVRVGEDPDPIEALEARIHDVFSQAEGSFSLAFMHLDEPDLRLFLNADTLVHAASTYKTAVMIEVFRQAEEGCFELDDPMLVKNEFRSIVDGSMFMVDGSTDGGSDLHAHLGDSITVRELTRNMIVRSGNLATNLLVERVGAEAVTATMRKLGADRIQIRRGVYDMKAYERGLNNKTTARDLTLVLEALARGRALNESYTREAVDILLAQEFTRLIPAQLPDEAEVAHKTGSISGIQHDSGIVYLPDGQRYVLVVLATDLEDEDAGAETIAAVSRLIYKFVEI